MSKFTIEHRPVVLPALSLCNPRTTGHKMMAEGHCRMCGRSTKVRPLTRHHLVPESWFMRQPTKLRLVRNAHANIIPLCRVCHDRVDDRDHEVRRESRRYLRRALSQQEIAFIIQVRGKSWLDHHYPRVKLASPANVRARDERKSVAA